MSFILSLFQLGAKYHLTKLEVEEKSEEAIRYAKKSAGQILILMTASASIFASMVMAFIELGRQLETNDPFYWSGMFQSDSIFFGVGLFLVGVSFMVGPIFYPKPKVISKSEENVQPVENENPVIQKHVEEEIQKKEPLIFLADEFLKEFARRVAVRKHARLAEERRLADESAAVEETQIFDGADEADAPKKKRALHRKGATPPH